MASLFISGILDWEKAAAKVHDWQAEGLKVGFTNGCFDILHAGHVIYLAEARQNCDRLVLGVNADSSVKRLKGESRPVHDEQARALVLSALESVDLVVIFGKKPEEADKAIKIIEALKPDIYFKGGDYDISQVPEAPAMQAYGGVVKIMSNVDGYSTTLAIEKMKD